MAVSFDDEFGRAPAMLILRGLSAERSVELARTGWDAGIRLVEVPLQDDRSRAALEAVVDAARPLGVPVGAGTIVSRDGAVDAAACGAAFTVAPGWDPAVAAASEELGMTHLPGAASATEIQAATAAGYAWLKAFPASVLGTEWFTAMRGPFPRVRFVATGGMTAQDATIWLGAGANAVALGSSAESADRALLERLARRAP